MKKLLVVLLALLLICSTAIAEETEPVFDQDGHKVTLSNMREDDTYGYLSIVFDLVYENNSDGSMKLIINNCYVNGWDVGALRSPETTPGHREKYELAIDLTNTDIKSFDEVETVELVFGYLDESYHYEDIKSVFVYGG